MVNDQQKSSKQKQKKLKLKSLLLTDYMARDLITFKPETEMLDVIDSLLEKRITGAPVLNDQNEVVGVIDDKDCLNLLYSGALYNSPVSKDTVARYMTKVMMSITVHDSIVDVANIFLTTKYKRLLVMDDDDKLVGQITRRDLLRAIDDLKHLTKEI